MLQQDKPVADTPVPQARSADLRRVPALRGPLSGLGLIVILLTCALDQAAKLWVLFVFDLGHRGPVHFLPLIDLILTWNTGISYGWLQQEGPFGQWALLTLKAIAVILLWIWLARASSRLTAVALGLIIGGAIGNAIDRLAYGAVADFIFLHHWYVFNLADVAIVVGVAGLLLESLFGYGAAKAPRSGG
jgi:signal peptidase II